MKKILLGTTAVIALSAMSTQAFAAEKVKLGLGGFMRQYVGLINNDQVAATSGSLSRGMSFSQWSNTEIYVKGSTKLDNGLKVSARVEFEADGRISGRSVDASFLTVSSDTMGALTMGSIAHAADDYRVGAPKVNKFDWDSLRPWGYVAKTATTSGSTFTYSTFNDFTSLGDDKSIKLRYVSPTFANMFTVYGSYSAAEGSDSANLRAVARNQSDDGYSFGVQFNSKLGGAAVKADLSRYDSNGTSAIVGTGSTTSKSPAGGYALTADQFGLNVGMSGVTVGGSYTKFNDNRAGMNNNDGNAWELGVAYKTGPYGVSARYTKAKTKGSAATAGNNEDTAWAVAASYNLGAGVALSATYFDLEANPEGSATATRQVNGVIAGIEVGF